MGITIPPPSNHSNVDTMTGLREEPGPAGSTVAFELRGSRRSVDRPATLIRASGQYPRPHGDHLNLLERASQLGLQALQSGATHALNHVERVTPVVRHLRSSAEPGQDAQSMLRQLGTDFTANGRLNDALVRSDVSREQLTALSSRPGKADAGTFYSHDGRHYIQDRYQDQVRVYEVYSDNAWATVRVRDPQRPHGQGAPVRYHNGHWRADNGGLLGGNPVVKTEEQWQEYLQLFNFDLSENMDMLVRAELELMFKHNRWPPVTAEHYLNNPGDRWRVFGLVGQPPNQRPHVDQAVIDGAHQYFDFSSAPEGHALMDWLLHDCVRQQGTRVMWPVWAAPYARQEQALQLYPPEQLLATDKGFRSPTAIRAYHKEFTTAVEPSLPIELWLQRISGHALPNVHNLADYKVSFSARINALINPSGFTDESAARAYLDKFKFPETNDGQILKLALLTDRLEGGRTPVWAGDYLDLEPWQSYRARHNEAGEAKGWRLRDLVSVLDGNVRFTKPATAESYLKQFDVDRLPDNKRWQFREELLLAKWLEPDRRPVWAIEYINPGSMMSTFKNEDIPASLTSFRAAPASGVPKSNWALPENMPELKEVVIFVRPRTDNWPVVINFRLPTNMPKLEKLHIEGVGLARNFTVRNLPVLEDITIKRCSGIQTLRIEEDMPQLKELVFNNNAHLLKLQIPCEWPTLERLDISDNAQLSEFQIPLGPLPPPLTLTEYVKRNKLSHSALLERLPPDTLTRILESEHWPALKTLRISNNPNLLLQQLNFPKVRIRLKHLSLENNNLADLSFLQGSHLPDLREINLSGNQLRDLEHLPAFIDLRSLELSNNPFVTLPDYIRVLPNTVSIDMVANNRLNPRIQQQFESTMATEGYTGAHVQFSPTGNDFRVRNTPPLAQAVANWFPAVQQKDLKRQWSAYAGEGYASRFSTFLDKLYRSPCADSPVFKNAVPTWLSKLTTDTGLRLQTFLKADEAATSYADRVSLAYHQMQEIALRCDVTNGHFDNLPTQLESELRSLYRLQQLDNFAQNFIRRVPEADEVEVFLTLREQLRTQLSLPGEPSNMLYLRSSRLKPIDFAQAKAYVLSIEGKTEVGFESYLLNSEAMRAAVKRQFPRE